MSRAYTAVTKFGVHSCCVRPHQTIAVTECRVDDVRVFYGSREVGEIPKGRACVGVGCLLIDWNPMLAGESEGKCRKHLLVA